MARSRTSDARSEIFLLFRIINMELSLIMDLFDMISDTPVSMEEMMNSIADRPLGRKCIIVVPF